MSDLFLPDEGVLNILNDKPFEYIKKCLDTKIIGEEPNKLALFLSKLTYFTKNPTHEIIQGESGVGKTHLALGVFDLFPEEDVVKLSRVTATWADYTQDELNQKIVLLQQLGGLSSSSDSIHIMMSERGLSLGTVKRVGNEWVSHRTDSNARFSLTSTTTRLTIDPQMETRTLSLIPDESAKQTAAIQRHQAQLDAFPWEMSQRNEAVRNVKDIIRYLRDSGVKNVVVPYSELIQLPNDVIRTRRDRPKILAIIKSLTMLRQMNRLTFEKDEVEYIIAEWDDCLDVLSLCGSVISQTIQQFSDADIELLDTLQSWFGQMPFTVNDVQKHTPHSSSTVRIKLGKLREKGVISVVQGGGRSRKNQYTINSYEQSTFLAEMKSIDKAIVAEVVEQWKERRGTVKWLPKTEIQQNNGSNTAKVHNTFLLIRDLIGLEVSNRVIFYLFFI